MNINDKIKTRRLQLGLTLEEVANKVGVAKSTVKKWESGQINSMRQSKIIKLANALNVDPAFLIFEDDKNITVSPTENHISNLDTLSPIDLVIVSICQNLNEKDKTKVIKFATKLLSSKQNTKE